MSLVRRHLGGLYVPVPVVLMLLAIVPEAFCRKQMVAAGPAPAGMVNLPYQQADGQGNTWMIYNYGWLQQQGNSPIYSQAAQLQINGQQLNQRIQQARIDDKTGEIVLENMQANNFTVTRRVLFNKEDGSVRYIDVIKNPQAGDQTINLTIQSNLNYGIQQSQIVTDPKKKGQQYGWVAPTHGNRCAVEMFAGKGAKVAPSINCPPGNSYVQATMQVTIPGNKEVAVMHLHNTSATQDQGVQWLNGIKENRLMATIPRELRKIIINFVGGQSFIGDYEVLRGDLFDVVELRGGDQVRGTLNEKSFKLETFYGAIDLPVDRVIGLINVGQFRPRQLVVTADGEIFGGQLQKETVDLQLSSGQVTQVPLSQISRIGYRKRPGEPEEWTFEKPFVLMRSGDRVGVQVPPGDVEINTRYGHLKIKPEAIAMIVFQAEDHGVHEVYLIDGSKFAGLVNAEQFQMKLGGAGPEQVVKFPASGISRLQFSKRPEDAQDDMIPTLELANEDVLVGMLVGELKLVTGFDTITLNGPEIRKVTHPPQGTLDVQVTLWDQTTVSGQLQQQDVQCKLNSGVMMTVPVTLVKEYNQPLPQPSAAMIERIKAVVAELNADDFNQRDRAQTQLTEMGIAVISVLKEVRAGQPPEAQQRIDQILKAVGETMSAPGNAASPVAPVMIDE